MSPKLVPAGRPRKDAADTKSEAILLRLEMGEKEGFRAAADIAGIDLSAWMRRASQTSGSAGARGVQSAGPVSATHVAGLDANGNT